MAINLGPGKVREFELKTGKVRKLNKLGNSRISKTNYHKQYSDLFYFCKWFMFKHYFFNNTSTRKSHSLGCFSYANNALNI